MADERQPKVSVYVLNYNHTAFIERCLKSIIIQTYRDFEVIYIDNNSPDGTFEKGYRILKESGVPFIAEKTSENLGCVGGMNYGLRKYCRGKYMTPLAGDDWWDMENLEHKVKFIENNPQYGMVYGNGYSYDNDTEEISLFYRRQSVSGWIFKDILRGLPINPEGILYSNEVLKRLDYYDDNAKVEDRDLICRVANECQIGYVHKPLTFYRVNHSGNASRNIERMKEGHEYLFNKYESKYPIEIKQARKQLHQYFAYYLSTHEPGWNSLRTIFSYFQFNLRYVRSIIKCILYMLKVSSPGGRKVISSRTVNASL